MTAIASVLCDNQCRATLLVSSDEELVGAHLAGNPIAFTTLVERYEDKLYRLAFRMLGNHHDALDAVQEVLIKLLAALAKFQHRSAFGTWLYRLAANTCLDVRRKRGRTAIESLDEAVLTAPGIRLPGGDSHEGDPDAAFEKHYEESLVREALRQLPKGQRELLEMRDLEELTNQEVAELLGIEVGAVKARLHRARQALKRVLDGGVFVPGYTSARAAGPNVLH